jgi:hypothetical protein
MYSGCNANSLSLSEFNSLVSSLCESDNGHRQSTQRSTKHFPFIVNIFSLYLSFHGLTEISYLEVNLVLVVVNEFLLQVEEVEEYFGVGVRS